MKKLFLMFGILCALSACDKHDDVVVCGPYEVQMTYSENGDTLHAVLNGDGVDLTNVVSASGARFDGVLNDINITLWSKGNDWTLFLGDDESYECK